MSANFSEHEFRDKRDGHYHRPPRELLDVLERIRAISGRPMRIVSGTRSARSNAIVSGATKSQHLSGRAADIPLGRATEQQALAAGARGVGVRGGWAVHLDVRPGPPAVWNY